MFPKDLSVTQWTAESRSRCSKAREKCCGLDQKGQWARWEEDSLRGVWGRGMKLGRKAYGGIRDEMSLGLWLVVPFTETGNTEGAEALGQRNMPVSCDHP